MEQHDSSCESSFCRDEKVEAMDLLEECWFFDNLLNIKPKMIRCHSDPYPSKGLISPDFLGKDSDFSSHSAANTNNALVHPKPIQRAPSMPPIRFREEDEKKGRKSNFTKPTDSIVPQPHCSQVKSHHHHKSDCQRRKSKLLRTPSLPPSIGREEKFQLSDHRNGRSHKQSSTPTNNDLLPPKQTSKSCSIPRYKQTRHNEVEILKKESIMEMRRRFLNQKTMRRSLSDLELEEVQGFKDLGFSFEKETLSPSLTNIIPGLQEKTREETEEDKKARRPYLSEAWIVQSCTPPIPNWTSHNVSKANVKEQIKFWARAVASNVHQEC